MQEKEEVHVKHVTISRLGELRTHQQLSTWVGKFVFLVCDSTNNLYMKGRNIHVRYVNVLPLHKGHLRTHKQSLHEGNKYPCIDRSTLHVGKKTFPCDPCNYRAAQKIILIIRTYQQTVHKGKKYPCDACDFFVNQI